MKFNIKIVKLEAPEECNLILGQSHFIKTVEDLHEAIVNTVPNAEFGLAFCEASGDCLVRKSGNNEKLVEAAAQKMFEIGCGHSFLIFVKNAFPINLIQRINTVPEVVNLYCATANPTQVLLAETEQGKGIIGVIDGFKPKGIESKEDEEYRKNLLRQFGYKL
ncbi:MAG: adenosine-specific kinase [Methanobacterium sp.]